MIRPGCLALYCVLTLSACGGSDNDAVAPYGLTAREAPVTVAFTANSGADADVAVINAYPQLQFDRPVDFAEVPGSGHAVVLEHPGRIRVFARDPASTSTALFADLTDRVRFDNNEQGLVRIAFDPDYANNGRLYLAYAGRQADDPARCAPLCSVLSRFTHMPGNPLQLDPSSETRLIVLPQPGDGHNIGNLLFGADGYLYVGVGDGGFSLTPYVNAQDRTDLYGSVLRLDVGGNGAYAIPPDNPFVGVGNEVAGVVGAGQPVREEIWAFGLRNPHRFSIDPVTGAMWLADVGQSSREEVNLITPGGNYGWPAYEGEIPLGRGDIGRDDDAYHPPVLTYPRSDGSSITGGLIYRGSQLSQLRGLYLFTDYVSGTLWSLDPATDEDPKTKTVVSNEVGALGVAGFSSIDDEVYLVHRGQGIVQQLVDGRTDNRVKIPETLSATGLFSDLASLSPAPGVIPYDVNAALWSDGTEKQRWLALPAGSSIDFSPTGAWTFPLGAVLVKHFALDLDRTRDDAPPRRLETRVMVNTVRGWIGYTYRWNAAQTDADLLPGRRSEVITVMTSAGPQAQRYDFPGTADCATCHNATAGFVLGLETGQMNRALAYPLAVDNQLRTLDHIGLFDSPLEGADRYPRWPDPTDAVAPLDARARAYLAANCAQCHNPDNTLPVTLNLRYSDDPADLEALGRAPLAGDLGVADARIIAPGDRHRSTLWLRMSRRGEGQMPPLATHVVDAAAVDLIGDWIDSLTP